MTNQAGSARPAPKDRGGSRHAASGGLTAAALLSATLCVSAAPQSADDAKATVAALDTEYQAAVARNDADAMARILADDFVLVTSMGKTYNKADLLAQARNKEVIYERQEEIPGTQTVRVWGNETAVVTALLWIKGAQPGGEPFDYKLWFSDTYVRTPDGWRYVFGQAAHRQPSGS